MGCHVSNCRELHFWIIWFIFLFTGRLPVKKLIVAFEQNCKEKKPYVETQKSWPTATQLSLSDATGCARPRTSRAVFQPTVTSYQLIHKPNRYIQFYCRCLNWSSLGTSREVKLYSLALAVLSFLFINDFPFDSAEKLTNRITSRVSLQIKISKAA